MHYVSFQEVARIHTLSGRFALCVSAPLSHSLPRSTLLVLAGALTSKLNSSAAQGAPPIATPHASPTPRLELLAPQAVPRFALACPARARTTSYVSTSPDQQPSVPYISAALYIFDAQSSQQVDARTTICDALPPRDYALNSPWLGDPIGRQGLVPLVARIGNHGRSRRRSAAAESFGLLRQLVCLPASPASSLAYYRETRGLPLLAAIRARARATAVVTGHATPAASATKAATPNATAAATPAVPSLAATAMAHVTPTATAIVTTAATTTATAAATPAVIPVTACCTPTATPAARPAVPTARLAPTGRPIRTRATLMAPSHRTRARRARSARGRRATRYPHAPRPPTRFVRHRRRPRRRRRHRARRRRHRARRSHRARRRRSGALPDSWYRRQKKMVYRAAIRIPVQAAIGGITSCGPRVAPHSAPQRLTPRPAARTTRRTCATAAMGAAATRLKESLFASAATAARRATASAHRCMRIMCAAAPGSATRASSSTRRATGASRSGALPDLWFRWGPRMVSRAAIRVPVQAEIGGITSCGPRVAPRAWHLFPSETPSFSLRQRQPDTLSSALSSCLLNI